MTKEEAKISSKTLKESENIKNLESEQKEVVENNDLVKIDERILSTVEELRGNVMVLTEEGETVSGLFTGKKGRSIGNENFTIETVEILNLKTLELVLIPAKTVVKNLLLAAIEKHSKDEYPDYFYCQFTFLGKKKGSNYTYDNYMLRTAKSTDSDVQILGRFEQ